ncbi:MAG: hypothetical protein ACLFVT_09570 [Syntrophobacteria bacterium]
MTPREVDLVIFAIQAAAKLGRKVQAVFEDEVRDRELILPPVPGTMLPSLEEAVRFFEGEGKAFVEPPGDWAATAAPSAVLPMQGLYYAVWRKRGSSIADDNSIREAYLRIRKNLQEHKSADDVYGTFRKSEQYYKGANALLVVKQWRDGEDPKRRPVQRIAGTVVEIALDYVKADPTLFRGDGIGDRVTRAFLLSLDRVEFAEADFDDLLLTILQAALDTFRLHAELVISEEHLASLLGEISATLSKQLQKARDSGEDDRLRALYTFRREMLQNVIQVSAHIVSEHPVRFFGTADSREERVLASVLQAVLATVQKESDLFSGRALADIYAAGLRAVAQNATLLLPETGGNKRETFIENLFAGIADQLARSARSDPAGPYSPEVLHEVIAVGLEVLTANASRLIDPEQPGKQLLVDALERVILSLSDRLHGDRDLCVFLREVFSREHLVEIVQEVFEAVARNPEALLHDVDGDARRSALAQVIGSVAVAARSDTRGLLSGENYTELIAVALQAFAGNPDRLLDLDTTDPMENVMAQVMTAVVQAGAQQMEDGMRNLMNGEMLVEMVEAALGVVSKNVEGFVREPEIVSMVMVRLLQAASNLMANELDGENLLAVFPPVVAAALRGREALDGSDADLILPFLRRNSL